MSRKNNLSNSTALIEAAAADKKQPRNLLSVILSESPFLFNLKGDFDILHLSRKGLPKLVMLALAKKLCLTLQEFANILHISERTLQRYEDDAIIKTEYAEKAIELARLYARGEAIFGSMPKFITWLKTPLHVFKGNTPFSLLDTAIGFSMIFKELGRIEYGIFA